MNEDTAQATDTVKDFGHEADGSDMEIDSAGVGISSESADGLSPDADRSPLETPSVRPAPKKTTPAPRAEERVEDVDDDDDDDVDDLDRASSASSGRQEVEPRSQRRSLDGRYKKLRRNIDRATFELRETERRLEQRRRELEGLGQSGQPGGDTRQPAASADRPAPAAAERPKRPRQPIWSEFEKAGKSWDDYEAAQRKYDEDLDAYDDQLTTYLRGTATQTTAERLEAERRRGDQTRAAQAHWSRVEQFRSDNEDWREVEAGVDGLESVFLKDAIFLHDKGMDIFGWCGRNRDLADALVERPLTKAMFAAVRESDNPVALLDYLAKNDAEHERIARLPYPSALKALGALEARLEGAPAGDDARRPGSPRVVRKPAAPPPSQRAGQRSGAPARTPENESVDDFVKRRTREERDARLSRLGLRTA